MKIENLYGKWGQLVAQTGESDGFSPKGKPRIVGPWVNNQHHC
jgi:hypothetical protein